MTTTVKELREWLATQPDNAPVQLAGVPDTPLVGWVCAQNNGTPVVLLAFGEINR